METEPPRCCFALHLQYSRSARHKGNSMRIQSLCAPLNSNNKEGGGGGGSCSSADAKPKSSQTITIHQRCNARPNYVSWCILINHHTVSDAWTNSSGYFWCGGVAALPWTFSLSLLKQWLHRCSHGASSAINPSSPQQRTGTPDTSTFPLEPERRPWPGTGTPPFSLHYSPTTVLLYTHNKWYIHIYTQV